MAGHPEGGGDVGAQRVETWIRGLLQRRGLRPLDRRFWERFEEIQRRRERLPTLVVFDTGRPLRVPLAACVGRDEHRFAPAVVDAFEETVHQLARRDGVSLSPRPLDLQLQPAGNPREQGVRPGPLAERHAVLVDGIVVDVDLPGRRDGIADYAALPPREMAGRLRAAGLPQPTVIVATGGGYHLVWLLRQRLRLPPKAHSRTLRALRAFHDRALEALHPFADRSGAWWGRPFRLPGSPNRKRGCHAHVVRLGPPLERRTFFALTARPRRRKRPRLRRAVPAGTGRWDGHPLFDVLREGWLRTGSRHAGIFLAAAAAWRAGAPEDELREFVRHVAEERCEDEPQPWASVVQSVLRQATGGSPYGISPERAGSIELVGPDGAAVDLAPLVRDFVRWIAARTSRPARRHTSGVSVLVRLLALAMEVRDRGDPAFVVEGERVRAPVRVWAERLGVHPRSIEHLRARLARVFGEEGAFLEAKRRVGTTVDLARALDPRPWANVAVVRRFAGESIGGRRVRRIAEQLIRAAREDVPGTDPRERIAGALFRVRRSLEEHAARASAKTTVLKGSIEAAGDFDVPRAKAVDALEPRASRPTRSPHDGKGKSAPSRGARSPRRSVPAPATPPASPPAARRARADAACGTPRRSPGGPPRLSSTIPAPDLPAPPAHAALRGRAAPAGPPSSRRPSMRTVTRPDGGRRSSGGLTPPAVAAESAHGASAVRRLPRTVSADPAHRGAPCAAPSSRGSSATVDARRSGSAPAANPGGFGDGDPRASDRDPSGAVPAFGNGDPWSPGSGDRAGGSVTGDVSDDPFASGPDPLHAVPGSASDDAGDDPFASEGDPFAIDDGDSCAPDHDPLCAVPGSGIGEVPDDPFASGGDPVTAGDDDPLRAPDARPRGGGGNPFASGEDPLADVRASLHALVAAPNGDTDRDPFASEDDPLVTGDGDPLRALRGSPDGGAGRDPSASDDDPSAARPGGDRGTAPTSRRHTRASGPR